MKIDHGQLSCFKNVSMALVQGVPQEKLMEIGMLISKINAPLELQHVSTQTPHASIYGVGGEKSPQGLF